MTIHENHESQYPTTVSSVLYLAPPSSIVETSMVEASVVEASVVEASVVETSADEGC